MKYNVFCLSFHFHQLKHLFAKQFALREKGLQMAQEALSSVRSQPRGEMGVWVRGAGELLKRALRDSVFSVSEEVEEVKYARSM